MKRVKVRRVKPPDKKETDQRPLISLMAAIFSLTSSIIALIAALLRL